MFAVFAIALVGWWVLTRDDDEPDAKDIDLESMTETSDYSYTRGGRQAPSSVSSFTDSSYSVGGRQAPYRPRPVAKRPYLADQLSSIGEESDGLSFGTSESSFPSSFQSSFQSSEVTTSSVAAYQRRSGRPVCRDELSSIGEESEVSSFGTTEHTESSVAVYQQGLVRNAYRQEQHSLDARLAQQERELQQQQQQLEAYERALDEREAYERALDEREAYERELDAREAYERELDAQEAYEREVDEREAYERAYEEQRRYEGEGEGDTYVAESSVVEGGAREDGMSSSQAEEELGIWPSPLSQAEPPTREGTQLPMPAPLPRPAPGVVGATAGPSGVDAAGDPTNEPAPLPAWDGLSSSRPPLASPKLGRAGVWREGPGGIWTRSEGQQGGAKKKWGADVVNSNTIRRIEASYRV